MCYRIGDKEYTNLVTAAQNPSFHRPKLIGCFASIGSLAARFGMNNLDFWIQSQIHLICLFSANKLAVEKWEKDILEEVVRFMQTTRALTYQHEIMTFVRLVLCKLYIRLSDPSNLWQESTHASLSIFADLYNDRSLPTKSPGLFGFLFASILSLGHRSSIWVDNVSRDGRRILYAAHIDLTRLRNHDSLWVNWLIYPASLKDTCPEPTCSPSFIDCWNHSFAHCGNMDSSIALEDIRQVVQIPLYREAFIDHCRASSWNCRQQCAEKTLARIDGSIERLFRGLTERHEYWARYHQFSLHFRYHSCLLVLPQNGLRPKKCCAYILCT